MNAIDRLAKLLEALVPSLKWLDAHLEDLFPPAAYDKDPAQLHMNQDPQPIPPQPAQQPPASQQPTYLWDTPEHARHSVRLICDEKGLSVDLKNKLSQTVDCESGYNPSCVHENIMNGVVTSIDYGIAQINDYWHIGPGKDFASKEYVLANPEACIRWMCDMWKIDDKHRRLWVCYDKGYYKTHPA